MSLIQKYGTDCRQEGRLAPDAMWGDKVTAEGYLTWKHRGTIVALSLEIQEWLLVKVLALQGFLPSLLLPHSLSIYSWTPVYLLDTELVPGNTARTRQPQSWSFLFSRSPGIDGEDAIPGRENGMDKSMVNLN